MIINRSGGVVDIWYLVACAGFVGLVILVTRVSKGCAKLPDRRTHSPTADSA